MNQKQEENNMWISPSELAKVAHITYRAAAKAMAQALREGRRWRGAKLVVREARGRGGSAGVRLEVRIDSLPPQIQSRIAARDAKPAVTSNAPRWTAAERELAHEAFMRKPEGVQKKAHAAAEAVRQFHSFAGSSLSLRQRYEEAAIAAKASPSSIRAWVKRCRGLDPGDWHVALAPRYGEEGGPPSAPISPAAWDFIETEYLQLSKPALSSIYERARYLASERSWALPSYATVVRLIDTKIPRERRVLMREGREAYDRLYSGAPRDYSTLKVHEVWCADGHKFDCWVRLEDGSIVRPFIIPWMDARSRFLFGYWIALVESAEAVIHSFRAGAERAKAIPEYAYIDNGMAFASKLFTGGAATRNRFKVTHDEPPGALTLLGVKPLWARPYNAKAKPIESLHRIFAEMARRWPAAYCGNRPDARPESCDPSKAVPIDEFRAVVAETVERYNNRPHRGDAMHGRRPREVYEELLPATVVRQPTKAQLRLCLMGRKVMKLSKADGSITLHGNRYWTKELTGLSPLREYVVAYAPEDAAQPLALYSRDGTQFLLDVPLQSKTGFRSAQAAKERAVASARARKAAIELEDARRAMREAGAWQPPIPRPEQASPSGEALPTAKVTRIDTDQRFKRRGDRKRVSLTDVLSELYRPKASGE